METLFDILYDKSEYLTSQEYVSAMNAVQHTPAFSLEREDVNFLLFLYVEQDTKLRKNPNFDCEVCCRTASRMMRLATQAANHNLGPVIIICFLQYLFKNGDLFERSPLFVQTTLNKLEDFATHGAEDFIRLNRLNQLHEWRAELARSIQ